MNDLQPIVRFARRWWWLMLLPVLIVGAFLLLTSLRPTGLTGLPPLYYSAQFRYTAAQVGSNVAPRDGDYQDVWLASEYTVNAFTEWIRSSTFRTELQTLLPELDLTRLGISSDNARSIGQVFLSYPDGDGLQRIAEAAITVLATRNQAYFPHLGAQPAEVTLLDAPVVSAAPPPLVNRFEPFLRLGLALIVGLMLALLAEGLDGRVRYDDDVTRAGLRILGKIPRG